MRTRMVMQSSVVVVVERSVRLECSCCRPRTCHYQDCESSLRALQSSCAASCMLCGHCRRFRHLAPQHVHASRSTIRISEWTHSGHMTPATYGVSAPLRLHGRPVPVPEKLPATRVSVCIRTHGTLASTPVFKFCPAFCTGLHRRKSSRELVAAVLGEPVVKRAAALANSYLPRPRSPRALPPAPKPAGYQVERRLAAEKVRIWSSEQGSLLEAVRSQHVATLLRAD